MHVAAGMGRQPARLLSMILRRGEHAALPMLAAVAGVLRDGIQYQYSRLFARIVASVQSSCVRSLLTSVSVSSIKYGMAIWPAIDRAVPLRYGYAYG